MLFPNSKFLPMKNSKLGIDCQKINVLDYKRIVCYSKSKWVGEAIGNLQKVKVLGNIENYRGSLIGKTNKSLNMKIKIQ